MKSGNHRKVTNTMSVFGRAAQLAKKPWAHRHCATRRAQTMVIDILLLRVCLSDLHQVRNGYGIFTRINNKEVYFIMTAVVGRKELLEKTLEGFRGHTFCLDGAREKGIIIWEA